MIDVKQAIQKAEQFLPEIFPVPKDVDLLLEGVELTDGGDVWTITLSFKEGTFGRAYRTVRIRGTDGQFVGARNGMLPEVAA
ncbi:MAG: hypothetical protein M3R43_06335 [Acidobacteriota bacterium]|nr:hypothetical protein [Acidobacteriota bacterium]